MIKKTLSNAVIILFFIVVYLLFLLLMVGIVTSIPKPLITGNMTGDNMISTGIPSTNNPNTKTNIRIKNRCKFRGKDAQVSDGKNRGRDDTG